MLVEVENWRPITGFEGSYEVSDLGNVRSLDRSVVNRRGITRIVRGQPIEPSFRGYMRSYKYVALWREKRRVTLYVHRAVLAAFVGLPAPGQEASHEPDPDPGNCRLDNLRWRTHPENCAERDGRLAGMSWADIQDVLARLEDEEGYNSEPGDTVVDTYDPVLTGETPF